MVFTPPYAAAALAYRVKSFSLVSVKSFSMDWGLGLAASLKKLSPSL